MIRTYEVRERREKKTECPNQPTSCYRYQSKYFSLVERSPVAYSTSWYLQYGYGPEDGQNETTRREKSEYGEKGTEDPCVFCCREM
jgi:hypothetical protein